VIDNAENIGASDGDMEDVMGNISRRRPGRCDVILIDSSGSVAKRAQACSGPINEKVLARQSRSDLSKRPSLRCL
jgi:Mg-chelatase subunit ChlD